jgi:hypothetical protein
VAQPQPQRLAPFENRVAMGIGGALLGATFTIIGLLIIVRVRLNGALVVAFLVPVLLGASWPAFVRQARRERNARIAAILMAALVLKLFGSMVRYLVAVHVYDGSADAMVYHDYGTALAMNFRAGEFDTGLDSLSDTNFIRVFTGVLYTVTGPSIHAGFLLYAWLAFWGMFYLYRAFTIAIPDGNKLSYARLLFFLPSMLYWPSSIGKEAWMLFALGLTAFGTARLLTGRAWRGLAVAGTGLYLAMLVRPHVAGIAGLGLVMAYLLARPPRRLGAAGSVVKLLALVALIGLSVLLLGKTQAYLLDKGIDPAEGVNSVLAESARRTGQGGSSFDAPSAVSSPVKLPLAAVTILFRPFLFEAHNAQVAVTALESTLLLALTISRRRSVWQAIRHPRRRPYVAFVGVYMAGFVFAFSTIANFGILARERTQLLPFFMVLLAIPARRRPPGQRPATARSQGGRGDADRQLVGA